MEASPTTAGVPQQADDNQPCEHCGKPGATARCARCRGAVYCGRACQRAHWRSHRPACRVRAAATAAAAEDAKREAMWHGMSSTAAERVEMAKLLSATDAAGAPLRAKILAEFEKRGVTAKGGMVPHFLRQMNADAAPATAWMDEAIAQVRAKEAERAPKEAPEKKKAPAPQRAEEGLLEVKGRGLNSAAPERPGTS